MNEWVLPSRIGGDRFKMIQAPKAKQSSLKELVGSGSVKVRLQFGAFSSKLTLWTVVLAGITAGLTVGIIILSLIKLFEG